jgi:formate dehydrogenase
VVKEGETPPPPTTIRVCDSITCELKGAEALLDALEAHTDPAKVRVLRAACMGRCDTAPVCEIGHLHVDNATVESFEAAVNGLKRRAWAGNRHPGTGQIPT